MTGERDITHRRGYRGRRENSCSSLLPNKIRHSVVCCAGTQTHGAYPRVLSLISVILVVKYFKFQFPFPFQLNH